MRHCPTENMIADCMSKPLQGTLFHTFRNVIMGWKHISTLFDIFSLPEERVGNNVISAVKPKEPKLTYAEAVRVKHTVEKQNDMIANNRDPLDQ